MDDLAAARPSDRPAGIARGRSTRPCWCSIAIALDRNIADDGRARRRLGRRAAAPCQDPQERRHRQAPDRRRRDRPVLRQARRGRGAGRGRDRGRAHHLAGGHAAGDRAADRAQRAGRRADRRSSTIPAMSPRSARALAGGAKPLDVIIDVDPGIHRTGVPSAEAAVALAHAIAAQPSARAIAASNIIAGCSSISRIIAAAPRRDRGAHRLSANRHRRADRSRLRARNRHRLAAPAPMRSTSTWACSPNSRSAPMSSWTSNISIAT